MARKLSGVERFHVHMLRHTFACAWVDRGGSLAALQLLLGHSSITTTQRYGRPAAGHHALQIEINRALYMDEVRHERLPAALAITDLMRGLLEELAAEAAACLLPRRLAAE